MAKTVTMITYETVREERRCEFTAEDWARELKWLEGRANDPEAWDHDECAAKYEAFKDITWDALATAIEEDDETLGACKINRGTYTYNTCAIEDFKETMQDCTCDQDPCDYDTDDFDYDIEVNEDEDEDLDEDDE